MIFNRCVDRPPALCRCAAHPPDLHHFVWGEGVSSGGKRRHDKPSQQAGERSRSARRPRGLGAARGSVPIDPERRFLVLSVRPSSRLSPAF